MTGLALYRKYRPYNFKNLVGQDNIKNTLVNALKFGNAAHAYLFSGPRGTGKTTTARLIAKSLNCEKLEEGFEPCNECSFCTAINDGNLIDLIEIDAASNRGIDEIRDLKKKINFSPSRSKVKVYIIDEVHMLTKEAFNALLKTFEEPPVYVYFILATTEVHKIPETIISRCQRFDFKRIDEKALMTRLSYISQLEGIKAEDKAIEAIARHVEGSLRDAIQLLEQLTLDNKLSFEHVQDILGISDFETLDRLFELLAANDTEGALALIQDVHSQGYDLNQFCHEFIDIVRKRLLYAVDNSKEDLISRYLQIINVFQKAKDRLKTYTIPQLSLEIAIIESTKNLSEMSNKMEGSSESIKTRHDVSAKVTTKGSAVANEGTDVKEKNEEKLPASEVTVDRGSVDSRETVVDNEPTIDSSKPLTLEYVSENWPRVTERIDIPACKRSLLDGEVISVSGREITIEFRSNFHRNKVMEHDNRVEVERILKEVFGKDMKVLGCIKEIEIGSVVSKDKDESSVSFGGDDRDHQGLAGDDSDELADQALEIFGGELMEEDNS